MGNFKGVKRFISDFVSLFGHNYCVQTNDFGGQPGLPALMIQRGCSYVASDWPGSTPDAQLGPKHDDYVFRVPQYKFVGEKREPIVGSHWRADGHSIEPVTAIARQALW